MAITIEIQKEDTLQFNSLKKLISEKKIHAAAIYPLVPLAGKYNFPVIDLLCFTSKTMASDYYHSFPEERRYNVFDLITDGDYLIHQYDTLFRIYNPGSKPPQQ